MQIHSKQGNCKGRIFFAQNDLRSNHLKGKIDAERKKYKPQACIWKGKMVLCYSLFGSLRESILIPRVTKFPTKIAYCPQSNKEQLIAEPYFTVDLPFFMNLLHLSSSLL